MIGGHFQRCGRALKSQPPMPILHTTPITWDRTYGCRDGVPRYNRPGLPTATCRSATRVARRFRPGPGSRDTFCLPEAGAPNPGAVDLQPEIPPLRFDTASFHDAVPSPSAVDPAA